MKIRGDKTVLGLTLVEMLMSVACGAFILAAVVASGVAMQRSYAAVEAYSTAEGDQLRVLDYIAMDARRAISVCVSGGVLSLTLPTYYSSVTNTAAANTPSTGNISITDCSGNTVTPTGYYGASGGSVIVKYQQSGTSFTREVVVKNSSGTVTSDVTTAIAKNVASFTVNNSIINNGTQANSVSCSIMFFPTFTHMTGSGTWRSGASAPGNGTGSDGDWYVVDTTASDPTTVGDVYFKASGSYSKIQNVKATTVACNTFLRNPVARQ
jgi:Tfp pilus assembly protein PilW